MLMNDKIMFDPYIQKAYYCINSAGSKEIRCRNERNMVHYILQPHHIFIHVKALFLCSFRADFSFSLLARALHGAW